ncbi:MAG: T9SS type A sorting domain-containing protein [Bacteroidetes bacterium]|nr:MAG: T9SS type A sorting domain-containing protein [Bacteroidota bacterium]
MKKIFYLLIAMLLAVCVNSALSQQQCTANLTNECGNCYQFTFTNNTGSPVDEIQVLVSGGSFYFSWGDVSGTAHSESWTFSPTSYNPNVTMLTFSGGTPIPNNSTKGTFHFCLSGDLQGGPVLTFRALSNKQVVCTTMVERPNYGICCDNLVMTVANSDPTPNDQGDCCYNFSLLAKTAFPQSTIFYVRFKPLNPGVSVGTKLSPTTPSGWGTATAFGNGAQFQTPAAGITPETHQYFKLCVFMPAGVTTFPMEITYTNRDGGIICSDTVPLTCDICAGLHLYPEKTTKNNNDQGDCCYNIKLQADRNYPGLTHVSFTPVNNAVTIGTALRPTSPSGWGAGTSDPPNGIKFATPGIIGAGPGLPSGAHELFKLCFNLPAGVSSFELIVKYLGANNNVICLDTVLIECQVIDRCDSLNMEREIVEPTPNEGDCCYQFRLTTSIDFPTIQYIKFVSLSAAVQISSALPPSSPTGWSLAPPAPPGQSVAFIPPGGYLHSGVHDSFRICYDIQGNQGEFKLEIVYLDAAGATVCTDTIDIKCQTSSGCDTLKMDYEKVTPGANDQGNCCYQFKLNAGMDMPDVFYVRFKSLISSIPIASAQPPSSPSGWGSASPTPPGLEVSFMAPAGFLHQGTHAHFRLCFDMPAGVNSLPVEIAYTNRDGKEICIDTVPIVCEAVKCDVEWYTEKIPVDNKNLKGDCCYKIALIVKNAIPGVAWVNFIPINPGVTIASALPAYSPSGWGPGVPVSPNGAKFHTPGTAGANLPNGVHKYFRLCFYLPAGVTSFPVEVQFTGANGEIICKDTLLMNCEKKDCEFEITGERLQVNTPATTANNLGDCCYAFKLYAHTDFPGVFYLNFMPVNPGVHITFASTPGTPPGWGSSTPNPPNGVRYLTPGLLSGVHGIPAGIHEYFRLCFDLPANVFSFQMIVTMTDREGKIICSDTVDVKCGEGNGTCENLKLNSVPYKPTPNDQIKGECCQSFMFTATANFPNINSVHFDSPAATIVGAVGPSNWIGPNPPPPSNGVSWNVPTPPGMLTAGNHGPFKLCFELKDGVTSFPVIITFLDQNGNVVCKFEQIINCKNCCDKFDSIDIRQKNIRQLPIRQGRYIWLQNSLTALPGPIIRAAATIVSAQIQTPTSSIAYHSYSDILGAKAFHPYWVPSGSIIPCPLGGPGTTPWNGLQGVFGTFRSEPFYSREVIWGDYRHVLSSVILNGANMEVLIEFPPVTSRTGDRLKFLVRYEFTDTNCCTCDKLVEYVIDRKYYSDNLTHGEAEKGRKDNKIQGQTAENDVYITMTDYQTGTLHISNTTNGVDAMTYTNVELTPQLPVLIASMHDNTSGNDAVIEDSTAKLRVNITAGGQTDITLGYDNALEKGLFYNELVIKCVYNDLPLDTFDIELHNINSRVEGGGGDQMALDNTANLQNVYTYALNLTNANSYDEGIRSIELKTPSGADLLAVGPVIDPQQIILSAYSIQGGNSQLLPQVPASAEVSAILPGESVKPIFISLRGTGTVNIDFITYNNSGEKMTEGTFQLVTSVVDLDDHDNQNVDFVIVNCYPNPTSNNVTFQFIAKHDLNDVSLELTDVTGHTVARILDNNSVASGNHVVVFNTNKLVSGAYYYTLRSGNNVKTGLLNIVK